MKLDIRTIPFSTYGSYMALNLMGEVSRTNAPDGLYLRSVHGLAYVPLTGPKQRTSARLVPLYGDLPAAFEVDCSPEQLLIKTAHGDIALCFADADTLLVKSDAPALALRLELTGGYLHEVLHGDRVDCMINSSMSGRRFGVSAQAGSLRMQQDWQGCDARDCSLLILPGERGFLASVADVPQEWIVHPRPLDYAQSLRDAGQRFEAYCAAMPEVPEAFGEARALAAYVNYAATVKKSGMLTRDAMLMSKNWMCNVWSWDHCFNAMALAPGLPEWAWDQFMLLFDYQDETGVIPDSISDAYIERCFCKPPIHGWALMKVLRHMQPTLAQLTEAYDRLCKWTNWWFNYRDGDRDGVCEYYHGNDSGWDNATAFKASPTVETPDLSAFLILQMDALAELAERLGRHHEKNLWRAQSDQTLERMLAHCFVDGMPVAKVSRTHEVVENDSLLLYLPVILGKKLPDVVRLNLIDGLKNGGFLTEHGFATERIGSALYQADGYWRGPIWAPSTMLIVEGLNAAGEGELATEVARRFCEMAKQNGFAENYDAQTGVGLRDRAYTWTSSVFLLLASEYLLDRE